MVNISNIVISDLGGAPNIYVNHVAEAVQLRTIDRSKMMD